jgi:hypothetical protein
VRQAQSAAPLVAAPRRPRASRTRSFLCGCMRPPHVCCRLGGRRMGSGGGGRGRRLSVGSVLLRGRRQAAGGTAPLAPCRVAARFVRGWPLAMLCDLAGAAPHLSRCGAPLLGGSSRRFEAAKSCPVKDCGCTPPRVSC